MKKLIKNELQKINEQKLFEQPQKVSDPQYLERNAGKNSHASAPKLPLHKRAKSDQGMLKCILAKKEQAVDGKADAEHETSRKPSASRLTSRRCSNTGEPLLILDMVDGESKRKDETSTKETNSAGGFEWDSIPMGKLNDEISQGREK